VSGVFGFSSVLVDNITSLDREKAALLPPSAGSKPVARQRKFSKTDIAKFVNAWEGAPHLVSNGAQYNYQAWLEHVETEEWSPSENRYKEMIAKAIIFKAAQKAVREGGFPGYRAQIVAYLVALVGDRVGAQVDLQMIWQGRPCRPSSKTSFRFGHPWWRTASRVRRGVATSRNTVSGRNVGRRCPKDRRPRLNWPYPRFVAASRGNRKCWCRVSAIRFPERDRGRTAAAESRHVSPGYERLARSYPGMIESFHPPSHKRPRGERDCMRIPLSGFNCPIETEEFH
jgi:hypothetical protein